MNPLVTCIGKIIAALTELKDSEFVQRLNSENPPKEQAVPGKRAAPYKVTGSISTVTINSQTPLSAQVSPTRKTDPKQEEDKKKKDADDKAKKVQEEKTKLEQDERQKLEAQQKETAESKEKTTVPKRKTNTNLKEAKKKK